MILLWLRDGFIGLVLWLFLASVGMAAFIQLKETEYQKGVKLTVQITTGTIVNQSLTKK